MRKFRIYADFNCPFCFVLNERLEPFIDEFDFEWKMIEHMPGLDSNNPVPEAQSLLTTEVFIVKFRAPDVPIRLPRSRPPTIKINEAYAAASQIDLIKASKFKQMVYRSLWFDGVDISDPKVINELLSSAGFEGIDFGVKAIEKHRMWLEEWEYSSFDRRIPMIVSDDGRKLLGLLAPAEIRNFLHGVDAPRDTGDVCTYIPKRLIMVVGRMAENWEFLVQLFDRYEMRLMLTASEAEFSARRDIPPDLILVDGGASWFDPIEVCKYLNATATELDIPLVLLDELRENRKQQALDAGVTLFLQKDVGPEAFTRNIIYQLDISQQSIRSRQSSEVNVDFLVSDRNGFERQALLQWQRGIHSKLMLTVMLIHVKGLEDIDSPETSSLDKGTFDKGTLDKETLQRAAHVLSSSVEQDGGFFAHYSDNTFAAVFPDKGEPSAVIASENCIISISKQSLQKLSVVGPLSLAIGLASMQPISGTEVSHLVEKAKQALQLADSNVGNKITWLDAS